MDIRKSDNQFQQDFAQTANQSAAKPIAAVGNTSTISSEVSEKFVEAIDGLIPLYEEKKPPAPLPAQIELNPCAEPMKMVDASPCSHWGELLARLEGKINELHAAFVSNQPAKLDEGRKYLTPAEFVAELKNRNVERAVEYIRRLCLEGGIKAKKRPRGRGKKGEWMIPIDELTRYKGEGPLRSKH